MVKTTTGAPKRPKFLPGVTTLPTGPGLPGHAACGPGKIFDHTNQRCISVLAYAKEHGLDSAESIRLALKSLKSDAAA